MRVGIEAWGLSGTLRYTGIGQYSMHLVEGLARLAPDVQVFAYGAPDEARPDWLPAPVTWTAPRVIAPPRAAALVSRLFRLRPLVAAHRIDVFHVPGVHLRPSLPPVPSLTCSLVVTVHDLIPLTYYGRDLPARLRVFYRWNLHRALRAQALVTVSEHARREIIDRTGAAPRDVTAIPNGVAFAPNQAPAVLAQLGVREPYILFAGSYEPRKNLSGALSAYARLVRDGLDHSLVAIVEPDSGHAAAVRSHAVSLGLDGRVRFVHSLPDADMRALYTRAAALLFPSFAEGFGFPPLQAAACGVPVVASDIGPVRETMGDAAIYVNPDSAESMAAGVRAVLDGPALRSRLAEAGRRRAAAYPWGRAVERHLEVYRQVACRASSPHTR